MNIKNNHWTKNATPAAGSKPKIAGQQLRLGPKPSTNHGTEAD